MAATPNSARTVTDSTATRRPPVTGRDGSRMARPRMARVIRPNIAKAASQARCAAVHQGPGSRPPWMGRIRNQPASRAAGPAVKEIWARRFAGFIPATMPCGARPAHR
ncbi:hypothetical protein [Nonomuraea rubra]|uniref:hypothetical protein n=1 Tax=Nonomuraea rubra TaxID=46180 RepID=UPI0031EFDC20